MQTDIIVVRIEAMLAIRVLHFVCFSRRKVERLGSASDEWFSKIVMTSYNFIGIQEVVGND
jgi:hypothetical protein